MNGSPRVTMRSLLRGHGHLGRERARFQFDITIEKVQGLHTGPHTIKWTRGGKVAYTKPFQIMRKSKESLSIGQKISLLCTLYRSKNTNGANSYEPKDSKLSLVSLKDGKKNEKTIGKIHFNIAQYAGVPSSEASVTFKLNRKVTADVTIACTFVQLSKTSSGSVGSGMSGLSVSSGEPEPEPEDDDDDSEDSGEESENPFSPITPGPGGGVVGEHESSKNPFDAAKEMFETKRSEKNQREADSDKIRVTFSDFSSGNNEKDHLTKLDRSTARKGANDDIIEEKNRSLQKEIEETRIELKKYQQLQKVSDDVIKDLREALSNNELEIRDMRSKHREALIAKTNEANDEIANVERCVAESVQKSKECAQALRDQIDSITCAKLKVEEELKSALNELEGLKNGHLQDSCPQSFPEPERSKKDAGAENQAAVAKLVDELGKNRALEEKCRILIGEISSLDGKLLAYNEHSEEVKNIQKELSSMYCELQERNIRDQQELHPLPRGRSIKRGRSLLRRAARSLSQDSDEGVSVQNARTLRKELDDANRKITDLETERAENQRVVEESTAHAQQMKKDLDATQSNYSALMKEFDVMRAARRESREKLEESERNSCHLRKQIRSLEQQSKVHAVFNVKDGESTAQEATAMHQRIVRVLAAASEGKRTIKKLKEDLQRASEREQRNDAEIFRLKGIVDAVTAEIQLYGEREKKRRDEQQIELDEAIAAKEEAKASLRNVQEEEERHREDISKLKEALADLESKAESARETSKSAILACRNDLQQRKEDLDSSATRIESLQRELQEKNGIEESLHARAKELELENKVIKRQTQHEVEMMKNAAREAEAAFRDRALQIEQYEEEVRNLRTVTDNLKQELQREALKARDEARYGQEEAEKNRTLRGEAEETEREYRQELSKQNAIIEELRQGLVEAASTNRKLSQEASDKAKKAVEALEEKQRLHGSLQQTTLMLQDRKREVQKLKGRIAELKTDLEEANERTSRGIERISLRLAEKEAEVEDMQQREEELHSELGVRQLRLSEVQKELMLSLRKCAELSKDHSRIESENSSLQSILQQEEERNGRNRAVIEEIEKAKGALHDELTGVRNKYSQLQEEAASLRTQLCESQNKLTAYKESSLADSSQTKRTIEEVKLREETYKQDIEKKDNLIDDLSSKLTLALGKNAADSAMAHAELAEAESREESYKAELKKRKDMLEKLEDEIMSLKGSNAFRAAEMEADLAEALSREETYQMEQKKLKGAIQELEASLEREKDTVAEMKKKCEEPCGRCPGFSESVLRKVDQKTAAGMRADKAMAEVLGIGDSLSSSNIRKQDMFEKITDAQLLEMLVETKMQLALAEEEKLQLEHLIRRIRDGDKHVQKKLAQQASKLEMKLTMANQMIDSMQDDRPKDVHRRESERSSDKSGVLKREKNMMKGDQLQFFRRQSGKETSDQSGRRRGSEQPRASREKPPVREWDLGDDSDDPGTYGRHSESNDSSFSARSSDME